MEQNQDFVIEIVTGNNPVSLEQLQYNMLPGLAKILADVIRRGIEQGTLIIVDNKVQFCAIIEEKLAGNNGREHVF